MKKNILIAAIAAVTMLASCSKEGNNNPGGDEGKGDAAYIQLSLKGASNSKAINEAAADDDQVINDMIVFVVRADDNTFDISPQSILGSALTGSGNLDLPKITATTKANKIYIVTNTGAYTSGAFKNCTSMSDVRKVAMKVDGNPNTTSHCKYNNVWMAGESTSLVAGTADPDGTAVKTASVQLNYLAAKVFIITENHMEDYTNPTLGGKTQIDGVAMINSGAYTGFVKNAAGTYQADRSTAYAQAPFYYNGVKINAAEFTYQDVPAAYPVGTHDFSVNSAYANQIGFTTWTASSDTHTTKALLENKDAFYVFPTRYTTIPADAGRTKVWATIYGKYNADGLNAADQTNLKQAFWSTAFGGSDGTIADPLSAGQKYLLTIELAGNANNGNSYEEDPTIESVNQYLKITVQQAMWTVSHPKKVIQ